MKQRSILTAFAAILGMAAQAAPAADEKPAHKKTVAPAVPKSGIKTPGIQIPFAKLNAEAEFEASERPAWLFFSTNLYFPAKDSIDRVDAKTNKKIDPVPGIEKPCGGMASAFGSLWTPSCAKSSLVRVDPKTLKTTASVPSGASGALGTVAATADSVWFLTDGKTTLSRIDPDQNAVVGELRVAADCRGLIFAETALWMACPAENRVLRVNPQTNLVDQSIEVSAQPESLAAGAGSIWALCVKEGKIDRIDPKTNKVAKTIELSVPGAEGQLAFGENHLWVTETGFPLTRIDVTAEKEKVLQQFHGEGGGAIAVTPGAIWLSNLSTGTVWRIDPKRVLATIPD